MVDNWNVIIVDDEPDNVGVLELVLQFHDAKVRIADSGEKCLILLKQEKALFSAGGYSNAGDVWL
jgi:CheY-like chemotaxis protein